MDMKLTIKKSLLAIVTSSALFATMNASAANLEITFTNITSGNISTPVIVAGHTIDQHMFRTGTRASAGLQIMAESGNIATLSTELSNLGASVASSPTTGNNTLIMPGQSVTISLTTLPGQDYLSLASMLLPSNDAFFGLDSFKIPTAPGNYRLRLNVYDAGTEANSEIRADMPAPPPLTAGVLALGTGGTGVTTAIPNNTVHIHPGNIGDFNATAGISDMNASVHRWLNPAAAVTVRVL